MQTVPTARRKSGARGRAGATAQSYGFFERWLTTDAGLGAVSKHLSNATED